MELRLCRLEIPFIFQVEVYGQEEELRSLRWKHMAMIVVDIMLHLGSSWTIFSRNLQRSISTRWHLLPQLGRSPISLVRIVGTEDCPGYSATFQFINTRAGIE